MKEDAPTPAKVPTKRRQLAHALDRWLAEWLARNDLTPKERSRVETERADRAARRKVADVTVGVLVGREGMTPEQADRVAYWVALSAPTVLCFALPAPNIARRFALISTVNAPDMQTVVRNSDVIVAAPRAIVALETPVTEAIRYARHRRVPCVVVLPNGKEAT